MIIQACQGSPVEIAVTITRNPAAGAEPTWIFAGDPGNPPGVVISPNGDMDFRASNHAILMTMTVVDPAHSWVFFANDEVNVFGYAEDEAYDGVRLIGRTHHQIRVLDYGDGHTIQVCYRNHRNGGHLGGPDRYPRSRYTTYLGEPGNTANPVERIDPIISNGGNTMQ